MAEQPDKVGNQLSPTEMKQAMLALVSICSLGPQPKPVSKFVLFLLQTSQKEPEALHSLRKTLTELRGEGSEPHL